MALKLGIVVLSTLLSPILGQLVAPTGLPSVSTNFKLIAHVSSSSPPRANVPDFNNWELHSFGDNDCDRNAVLSKDPIMTTNSSFFFSGDSTVNYIHRGEPRMLYIANGIRRAVWLGCAVQGEWHFGVGERDHTHAPQLQLRYEGTGQFYACPKVTVQYGTLGQLYYRKTFEKTPAPCVEVDLYAVCSDTLQGRGDTMVPCCRRIGGRGCLS